MQSNRKVLTKLGILVVGGALTACGTDSSNLTKVKTPSSAINLEAVGTGGEGEGGIAIERAIYDPVVYLTSLAITHAHIIAARDAHLIGENEAAAEMFAHPVSEVLAEMQPVFRERGAEDFSDLLIDASNAILDGTNADQLKSKYSAITTALDEAAKFAPSTKQKKSAIYARVIADQIERAVDMYPAYKESGRYEPYLDGYGYYKAGESLYRKNKSLISKEHQETIAPLERALKLLANTYPSATPNEMSETNLSKLRLAASNCLLVTSNF